MYHFIAIAGTNSFPSTNRQLINYISNHFHQRAQIDVFDISQIEPFCKDDLATLPDDVEALQKLILELDGVIIATPEYDHTAPAVLLNVLEWLSIGAKSLVDKPVLVTGASYGTLGTSRAQSQLRQVLNAPELMAAIMPSSEFYLSHSLDAFDDKGNLKSAEVVERLEALFNDFLTYVTVQSTLTSQRRYKILEANATKW